MSVRDLINQRQIECRSGDLMPARAGEVMVELSSLLGNINNEILEREIAYNKKLLECLDKEKTANKAKIIAETSDEYRLMREAKNAEKVALEIIRSLKYYLRVKEDEMMQAGNM